MNNNIFGNKTFYINFTLTSSLTIKTYAGCVYNLDNNINAGNGDTLTIDSGVTVNLGNHYLLVGSANAVPTGVLHARVLRLVVELCSFSIILVYKS